VFTREDGSALHPEYVSRHFERLARNAGLPPVRLHDLRHGAATLALAGGADLKTVSEMLGHSTFSITADTYASVLPKVARSAAEAAARLVPRGGNSQNRSFPAPFRPHLAPKTTPALCLKMQKARSQAVGPVGLEPTTYGLKVRSSAY
jgi:Phage integrase family